MTSKTALAVLFLATGALTALAAEPYGATIGGKSVTSVERPVTKDLELGRLSRDELLQAARSSHPSRLTPSSFGPGDLGGATAPAK